MSQLALALDYLHSKNVIFRDLKVPSTACDYTQTATRYPLSIYRAHPLVRFALLTSHRFAPSRPLRMITLLRYTA